MLTRVASFLAVIIVVLGFGLVPASAQCAKFSISSASGSPTQTVTLEVTLDHTCLPCIQGWSYGVCHDPSALSIVSLNIGSTGGVVVEFHSVTTYTNGFTAGVVFDAGAPFGGQCLPPGNNYQVELATYSLLGPLGNTSVCVCDTLGSPVVPVQVGVAGVAVPAAFNCGRVNVFRLADECADAADIPLLDGVTPFDTTGATTSPQPPTCGSLGNDIWFCYRPACSGIATVNTCGSSFDTVLEVFDGCCCPSGSPLACNDNAGGAGPCPVTLLSFVSFAVLRGETYLVRVGGIGGAFGPGVLEVSCLPDNACLAAIPVSDGVLHFSTALATTDGPPFCAAQGNDMWYCYTARCTGTVEVHTCGSSFDTVLAAYDGCGCPPIPAPPSILACNDDTSSACPCPCPNALQSYISFPVVAGDSYLLQVGGFNNFTGDVLMTIRSTPGRPVNDDCLDALAAVDGVTFVDNTCATDDGPSPCVSQGSDIWYCYTARCNGIATIDTFGSAFDTVLSIYDGCCCVGPNLACNDDFPGFGLQSQVSFPTVVGNKYLIQVGGFAGLRGTGMMTIACPPVNNQCFNALPVACNTSHPFDTTGSATDGPSQCGGLANDIWYCVTAPLTGMLTVDTCGSLFDTVVSIYSGCMCPAPLPELCCNDDAPFGSTCSGTLQSWCCIPVVAGSDYLIQVGGFLGDFGQGTLNIACGPACSSGDAYICCDCNCDGQLDIADVICMLGCLFPTLPLTCNRCCFAVSDCNMDAQFDIADPITLLQYLFPPNIPPPCPVPPGTCHGSGCPPHPCP